MPKLKTRGLIPLLVLGTIALTIRFLPDSMIEDIAEATVSDGFPESEYYQLVEGSISDGDTLRVTDGSRELKIRLCGIDAPELKHPMGIEARDHLRSLIDRGDGTLIVLAVERDRYGRTLADIFVPLANTEEEISLMRKMVLNSAYHYGKYSDRTP